MINFENRLCDAWEHDGLAYLAAILTFDGARQWVFYTGDVGACRRRLNELPGEEEPYPIELTTEPDPDWTYLHTQILRQIDWRQYQEEWERALNGDA